MGTSRLAQVLLETGRPCRPPCSSLLLSPPVLCLPVPCLGSHSRSVYAYHVPSLSWDQSQRLVMGQDYNDLLCFAQMSTQILE